MFETDNWQDGSEAPLQERFIVNSESDSHKLLAGFAKSLPAIATAICLLIGVAVAAIVANNNSLAIIMVVVMIIAWVVVYSTCLLAAALIRLVLERQEPPH